MPENILVELSTALADAAERAGSATVMVNARRRLPASGIGYSPDLILTADHVVERDEDISVFLPDSTEFKASVAGRDPGSDLALLKLESSSVPVAKTATSPARVGQVVLALGRPDTEGIQASLGVVSAIGGPVRTGRGGMLERYLRTDAIPYPGFSGGPLVAADGTVFGINTSGLARGASLTIPVDLAWKVAETLSTHGHIRRGYLGIRSQAVELSEEAQNAIKREQVTGLLVVGVEKGSPAAKGGLMVGDILAGIKSMPVLSHDELFAELGGEVVGQSTPIEVLRGGQPVIINVIVGER